MQKERELELLHMVKRELKRRPPRENFSRKSEHEREKERKGEPCNHCTFVRHIFSQTKRYLMCTGLFGVVHRLPLCYAMPCGRYPLQGEIISYRNRNNDNLLAEVIVVYYCCCCWWCGLANRKQCTCAPTYASARNFVMLCPNIILSCFVLKKYLSYFIYNNYRSLNLYLYGCCFISMQLEDVFSDFQLVDCWFSFGCHHL